MRNYKSGLSYFRTLLVSAALLTPAISLADISVSNAWSPAAPPVAKVMAGYMDIKNSFKKHEHVVSASSPLFNKVEIHQTEEKDGMMRMIQIEYLELPGKGVIRLKPGGLHMMLIGKKKPIRKGDSIPVTLKFTNNTELDIKLNVKEARFNNSDQHHHH